MKLKITEKEQDKVMVVCAEGEVDASTADILTNAFTKIMELIKFYDDTDSAVRSYS